MTTIVDNIHRKAVKEAQAYLASPRNNGQLARTYQRLEREHLAALKELGQ